MRRGFGGKVLSVVMSVVLAMGLMPLPAFADSSLRAGGFAEPQEEAADSERAPLQDAVDAAGSALSTLGANVMGAISTLDAQSATAGDNTLVHPSAELLESGTTGVGGAITWEYYDDATLEIHGEGALPDYTATSQPWNSRLVSIERVEVCDGVTGLGSYAFYGCTFLSQVKLPDSLTDFGNYTFYMCDRLKQVVLPATLERIGERALYNCPLESLAFPDTLREIGKGAISAKTQWGVAPENAYCKIYRLPASLAVLGESAFTHVYFCNITWPTAITAIPYGAFSGCMFDKLEIPQTVTSIGRSSFASHKNRVF